MNSMKAPGHYLADTDHQMEVLEHTASPDNNRDIIVNQHYFNCTASAGSICRGAMVE